MLKIYKQLNILTVHELHNSEFCQLMYDHSCKHLPSPHLSFYTHNADFNTQHTSSKLC